VVASSDKVNLTKTESAEVRGQVRDPALVHQFKVSIEGLWEDYEIGGGKNEGYMSFSKISGIGSTLQTEAMREGTSPVTTHTPVGITYNDVTLEAGIATSKKAMAVMRWYRDTVDSVYSSQLRKSFEFEKVMLGQVVPRIIVIIMPTHKITLVNAWPVSASFGDLNANASEVWIYSLTLKYSGIILDAVTPKQKIGATTSVPGF